ncbi:MAG: hypothetical protein HYV07_12760 [Deltaproteobacteria bacterium]|nr:hypothetical protein [Deltaproteobacteria bacterium]
MREAVLPLAATLALPGCGAHVIEIESSLRTVLVVTLAEPLLISPRSLDSSLELTETEGRVLLGYDLTMQELSLTAEPFVGGECDRSCALLSPKLMGRITADLRSIGPAVVPDSVWDALVPERHGRCAACPRFSQRLVPYPGGPLVRVSGALNDGDGVIFAQENGAIFRMSAEGIPETLCGPSEPSQYQAVLDPSSRKLYRAGSREILEIPLAGDDACKASVLTPRLSGGFRMGGVVDSERFSLAAVTSTGAVLSIGRSNLEPVAQLPTHPLGNGIVATSPDGELAVLAGAPRLLRLKDGVTREEPVPTFPEQSIIRAATYLRDGRLVVVGMTRIAPFTEGGIAVSGEPGAWTFIQGRSWTRAASVVEIADGVIVTFDEGLFAFVNLKTGDSCPVESGPTAEAIEVAAAFGPQRILLADPVTYEPVDAAVAILETDRGGCR